MTVTDWTAYIVSYCDSTMYMSEQFQWAHSYNGYLERDGAFNTYYRIYTAYNMSWETMTSQKKRWQIYTDNWTMSSQASTKADLTVKQDSRNWHTAMLNATTITTTFDFFWLNCFLSGVDFGLAGSQKNRSGNSGGHVEQIFTGHAPYVVQTNNL